MPPNGAVHNAKLADLTPDSRNANKGTARGRKLVAESLTNYGAGRSILLDKNGNIIAGNKTVEGAKAVGLDDVVIVRTDGNKLVAVQRTDLDLGDKKARELAIADNRSSELGLEWDPAILAEFEKEIDLGQLWSPQELDKLLADFREEKPVPEPQLDKAAELQQKWNTQRGQIWEIGKHRLMCGDSTSSIDVPALLVDAAPELIVTDPPYGISLDMEWRDRAGLNIHGPAEPSYMRRGEKYANKDMSGDTRVDWSEAFGLVPSCKVIYVAVSLQRLADMGLKPKLL